MPTHDPRVDAYIEKSAAFAQPILRHLREVVHAASPKIEETIKWGFPHFEYHGLLCNMAAFKQHASFGFWKGKQLDGVGAAGVHTDAMGQFGRLTTLADVPSRKVLTGLIRAAMLLNEPGAVVSPRASRTPKAEFEVPEALAIALRTNAKARRTFDMFPPSHRRDYCEWIDEAKREETRTRRIATAMEWLAEGKSRNWKYAGGGKA
jgi:hypothetical protein